MILLAWVLAVCCSCALPLLEASRDISSSVMVTDIFFLMTSTSFFSLDSASAKRLLRVSISIRSFFFWPSKSALAPARPFSASERSLASSFSSWATLSRAFVCSSQLLSLVGQLAVVSVHVGIAFLERVKLHLEGLELVFQLSLVSGEGLVGHSESVHLVA